MHEDCVFCKYTDEGTIVYNGSEVYAIVSKDPINTHHILVIPREHYINFIDLPSNVMNEITSVAQVVSKAIREFTKPEAITFVTIDEVRAQGHKQISHFKLHIIPRYKEDLGLIDWEPLRIKMTDLQRAEVAKEIRDKI